jgi:UDP-N-acetylmuramoylalanine--D-glutamate ligase
MPLSPPEFLRPLLGRPVAVFGKGESGQGARALLGSLGASCAIYDASATAFTAAAASRHALAVFSPGFAPDHPWIRLARDAGCECLGEIDFASLCWRGDIVAVTGTNGKTTLTEFLTHALLGIGRNACATGNVGTAFSRVAAAVEGGSEGMTAVCEVSSFQAETLRHFRARAALWTNFAEDHLERHGGIDAYFAAKAALALRSEALFAGPSVRAFALMQRRPPGAPDPFAHAAWVRTEGQERDPRLDGTVFADYPQRENFLLAAAWWRSAGHEMEALYAAARSFRLGRHRLARVAEIGGVTYWNDSKATNFHAVEAALARFEGPVLLIAGGRAKGGDLAGFVRRIAPRVRHSFLIGETRAALAERCAADLVPHTLCETLDDAVRRAASAAGPGDHVVLSPGFASFDMFRGYEDRGERFEKLAREQAAPLQTT